MSAYFKVCLLSPIWAPVILCAILVGRHHTLLGGLPDTWLWFGITAGASVLVGGVQYLIAMVIVWCRIDFHSFQSILRGCLVLPIIFTPIQMLGISVFMLSDGSRIFDALFGLAALDLAVGYGYVGAWFVFYWLFTCIQKLRGREMYYE